MAFAIRNLSVLAYANGFTLWHYRANVSVVSASLTAPATIAEVCAPGFFAPAADMLAQGDMLMVSARDGATVIVVGSVECGVTTAPLTAVAPAQVAA